MTPEQSARDPLPKVLRQLSDILSVDVDYDPKLDDPPRSKITAIGAVFGLGLGALIGALVGDDGPHGAVFGCLIGIVIGTIVCGGAAAAIAVNLYPDASSDESGEDAQGLSSDDGNAVQETFEPIQSIVHSSTNAEV